jgi:hypothetical protein
MVAIMMVTLSMENSTEKVNTISPILVRFMREISKTTICMAVELWSGQINRDMMDSLKTVNWTVTVSCNTPKAIDMLVCSKMILKTELEFGTVLKIKLKDKASG